MSADQLKQQVMDLTNDEGNRLIGSICFHLVRNPDIKLATVCEEFLTKLSEEYARRERGEAP